MSNTEKSTDELINEIKSTSEINKFIERNDSEFLSEPLHDILNRMLKKKKLKKSEVVAGSSLNRIYGY